MPLFLHQCIHRWALRWFWGDIKSVVRLLCWVSNYRIFLFSFFIVSKEWSFWPGTDSVRGIQPLPATLAAFQA